MRLLPVQATFVKPVRPVQPGAQPIRFASGDETPELPPTQQKILDTIAELVVVHKACAAKHDADEAHKPVSERIEIDPQGIELSQIYDAFDALNARGVVHWVQNIFKRRELTEALWQLSDTGYIRFSRSIHQTAFDRTRPKELPADYVALFATEKGLRANSVILYQDVAPTPDVG